MRSSDKSSISRGAASILGRSSCPAGRNVQIAEVGRLARPRRGLGNVQARSGFTHRGRPFRYAGATAEAARSGGGRIISLVRSLRLRLRPPFDYPRSSGSGSAAATNRSATPLLQYLKPVGTRPVVKHVALVTTTARTVVFLPWPNQLEVALEAQMPVQHLVEAGPAGPRVVFPFGAK